MQPTPELQLAPEVDDGHFRLDVVFPSWCLSIVTHVILFVILSLVLRGCSPTGGAVGPKVGEGTFREVGLHVQAEQDSGRPAGPGQAAEPGDLQGALISDSPVSQPDLPIARDDSSINDLLNLPPLPNGISVIGPGPTSSLRTPASANELIKRSGQNGNNRNGGGGRGGSGGGDGVGFGETNFFDIAVQGNRFVYVVDRSGSMYDHNAIRVAKEKLVASLAALDQTQQFQLIFYNTELIEMRGRDDKPQMQWATEINRTLARQFISSIQPDGGTDHVPPLRKALRYQPEHLFFLTDADQPQLSARELNEIRVANGGRTKIHCVEFGKGSEINADNFLKRLARENGGTYRYRDVTGFDRRPK